MTTLIFQLNKKMLLCIATGIFCAVMLGFSMNWIEQFQKEAAYREYQYNTGSYIAYFSGELSRQDIDTIASDAHVSQCGIVTYYKKIFEGSGKDIWLRGANENYMLRNSTVLEGALPEAEHELIAQQWVLEAIGVEPKSGQVITLPLEDENGNQVTEEFIVSGVLENSAYAKENGLTEIFVPYDDTKQQYPIVNLDIKEGYDLLGSLQSIQEKLTSKGAFYEYSNEAGAMRVQRTALTGRQLGKSLFAAGLLLFYFFCIYRLSEEQFMQNTAKLRMCGFSIRRILTTVLKLFFIIYIIFGLLGLAAGKLCVHILMTKTHLDKIRFTFWGEKIAIAPKLFLPTLLLTMLFSFAVLLLLFAWVSFKSTRGTILEQFRYGERAKRKSCRMKKTVGRKKLLSFRTEWVSIALLCLAQVLFLSVSYWQQANERMTAHEVFSQCKNGDFQVLGYQSENISNGATKEQLEAVEQLAGTVRVETAAVLPVRVKLENGVTAAADYYKMYNEYAKDTYYKEFIGTEPESGDIVYKSSLMGYNNAALERLSDYVTDGHIDLQEMQSSNTAVLFVPQYMEGKYRQRFYRNAKPVMDYKVGDCVTVKIRDNYTENMEQYWAMEDAVGSHEETFEIAAIVYYPYLPNTSAMGLVNPDVIISSKRMEQLTGQQVCRVVNIQTDCGENAQQYAEKLNGIFSSVGGTSVNDLLSARTQQQMRSRIYALVGLLWSLLLGIGFASCGVIGVKHQLLQRKRDLALCRMVGFSKRTLQSEAKGEAVFYVVWISLLTVGIAFVLQRVMFIRSGMQVMGLSFWGNEALKGVLLFVTFFTIEGLFVRNTRRMLRGEIMAGYREE